MMDHIWVKRTLIAGLIAWLLATAAASWQGQSGEATFDVNIFAVVTILAANVDESCLGRDSGSADDDSRNSNQMRDIGRVEITNGDMRG